MLVVVDPGPQALVQDAGRIGHAAIGVPSSGVFDRATAAVANRMLGNPPGTALLELALGPARVRWEGSGVLWVSAVSPAAADLRALRPGEEFTVGPLRHTMRACLAVRGGLCVPPTLGSSSTDTLSGLGPTPLRAGDRLEVGAAIGAWPGIEPMPVEPGRGPFRVVAGPREDWVVGGVGALTRRRWTVSARSDRVGLRLDGLGLDRARTDELPSEGMVTGSIQVPPSGQPIVFGPDHPVTGGYPVVATVVDADLDRLARLRPGDEVRFAETGGTSGPTR